MYILKRGTSRALQSDICGLDPPHSLFFFLYSAINIFVPEKLASRLLLYCCKFKLRHCIQVSKVKFFLVSYDLHAYPKCFLKMYTIMWASALASGTVACDLVPQHLSKIEPSFLFPNAASQSFSVINVASPVFWCRQSSLRMWTTE